MPWSRKRRGHDGELVMALLGQVVNGFLDHFRIDGSFGLKPGQQLAHGTRVQQRTRKAMLARLARLFQNVNILLGKGRSRGPLQCELIVVSVDQLRQAQCTGHTGRAAADDDHIRFHLRPFDALDWFTEVDHGLARGRFFET